MNKVIGAFESVGFPEFGIEGVTAKIDTGAYTGALHCSSIKEKEGLEGKTLVFVPLTGTNIFEKDEFAINYVRSSNGKREKRYFISTDIQIHGLTHEIMLSLTSRHKMKWPVLIGRRFLQTHHFLVDPTQVNKYREQAPED